MNSEDKRWFTPLLKNYLWKRLIACILIVTNLLCMTNISAFAQETEQTKIISTCLYKVNSQEDEGYSIAYFVNAVDMASRTTSQEAETYYSSGSEAAAYVREKMKLREETVVFGYQTEAADSTDTYSAQISKIMDTSMYHTGNPIEGDYLQRQFAQWYMSLKGYEKDGIAYLTATVTISYYTTSEQ